MSATVSPARGASGRHDDLAARALLAIAGFLLSLVGAMIALGGQLSPNGSAFHVLAGCGLILSGILVAKRHRAGAWAYMAVFVVTVAWSLRNVQHGGTPLAMRLLGPTILLAMIGLLMPVLRGWHPRNTAIVFAALTTAMTGLGISSTAGGPLAGSTAALTQILD